MLSVARLVNFWRCIPVQYNCQKSSNFQGLSHFSRIFGKNDKIPGFFQAGKTVTIFPGFPGAVGTLTILVSLSESSLIFFHLCRFEKIEKYLHSYMEELLLFQFYFSYQQRFRNFERDLENPWKTQHADSDKYTFYTCILLNLKCKFVLKIMKK